jgi:hypothetical protein
MSEYLTASAYRRSSIVREAKYPKTLMVTWYREARLAIARALSAGEGGEEHIHRAIKRLRERSEERDASSHTLNDCRLSIAMLETFLRTREMMGLSRFQFRPTSNGFSNLDVAGVAVSVTLCATAHKRGRDGADRVGGVVLMTSKDVSAEEARLSAQLCHMFARTHLTQLGIADKKLCLALDVNHGVLMSAPSGELRRVREMEHSCAEIVRAWPSAVPPSDYDGPDDL